MSVQSMRASGGRRVVAVDNAEELGSIKEFVVAPSGRRIDKVQIGGRGKKAEFARWSDLESFGADVVMAERADIAEEAETDRDTAAAKGNVTLLGARILDTDGFEHGAVEDAEFDTDDGSIVSVSSSAGTIGSDRIRSLGAYALVVDADDPHN